jgi:hypothetical protein
MVKRGAGKGHTKLCPDFSLLSLHLPPEAVECEMSQKYGKKPSAPEDIDELVRCQGK